jgi:hypothetical protein
MDKWGWFIILIPYGELNRLRNGAGNFVNMPSSIVPKPPKPGFGRFGAIDVGVIWSFGVWIQLVHDRPKLCKP